MTLPAEPTPEPYSSLGEPPAVEEAANTPPPVDERAE